MFKGTITLAVAALMTWSTPAAAQAASDRGYPDRPVRLIAAFPPGTSTDIWARAIAQALQQRMGQPVVVENKVGAGGQLAADHVAKSPADGYTLLISTPPNAVHITLFRDRKLPYDFRADFVPVVLLARYPLLLVTSAETGPKNLAELLATARAKPGTVSFASFGQGSSAHLTGELLSTLTKTSFVHVPYKGASAAHPDLIAGRVGFMFENPTSSLPHLKSGRLRALTIAADRRLQLMSDVQTGAELGVRGLEASTWVGIHVRRGTPEAIVTRLNAEIDAILKSPELRAQFEPSGAVIGGGSPAAFAAFFDGEVQTWGRVVETTGIKPE
jgi:tripartite-type tricarboxylate transporter receptor subunit TctC